MVRVRIVGGKLDGRPVPGLRRPGADVGNGTLADHDPPGVSAPRRPEGRPGDDHPPDQRDPALDPGGLRRRRAQRALLPRPAHDSRSESDLQADAHRLGLALRPRASSYWDIWLDGEKIETLPPAGPSWLPTAGRRSGRADLRQGVPAAQVQDGLRLAGGQLHRHSRQRPGFPGDRRGRAARRLQRRWSAAAWARRRAPRRRFLSWPCRSATSIVPTCSRSARRCSRSSATSATAPTASGPGSSTSSTTGVCPPSGPRSRSTWAVRWPTRGR